MLSSFINFFDINQSESVIPSCFQKHFVQDFSLVYNIASNWSRNNPFKKLNLIFYHYP